MVDLWISVYEEEMFTSKTWMDVIVSWLACKPLGHHNIIVIHARSIIFMRASLIYSMHLRWLISRFMSTSPASHTCYYVVCVRYIRHAGRCTKNHSDYIGQNTSRSQSTRSGIIVSSAECQRWTNETWSYSGRIHLRVSRTGRKFDHSFTRSFLL